MKRLITISLLAIGFLNANADSNETEWNSIDYDRR